MPPSSHSARARRSGGPAARRTGRIVACVLGVVALLAVAGAAWIGVRAALAAGHLDDARATASALAADIDDPAAAAAAIDAIAADADAAHELTSDPIWRLAEGVPWIGPQLAAVGTVAAAADDVAGTALQPLAEVAATFSIDALRPVDGAIDTAPIAGLREAAAAGADGMRRATASVDGIDDALLLPPLRGPVDEVRTLLSSVGDGADALARASALMPAMLGADGPRSYLVVFQNNAEWRSLGGIVGATAVVGTDAGRLSLTAQGSSGDFRRGDEPAIELSDELIAIYGTRPARYIQNATQVADFPTAAQIARRMWADESGQQVDGVLAIDPVALSYLLSATGPVPLPTGDVLTTENAVSLLLNEVYLRYENPADQDAFFQAAAAAVFQAIASGGAEPAQFVEALARAGGEDRLLLWNARAEEQALLDGTTLQGNLPTTDAERTTFGVYLNDGTGSKMDFYLRAATAGEWCAGVSGAREAVALVTLRNDAPPDARLLPPYVTGGGAFAVPPGVVRTVAYVYLPRGASLISATESGPHTAQGFGGGSDRGHRVLSWTTDLAPGQEAELRVAVSAAWTPEIAVRSTPTVNTLETHRLAKSCESAGQ